MRSTIEPTVTPVIKTAKARAAIQVATATATTTHDCQCNLHEEERAQVRVRHPQNLHKAGQAPATAATTAQMTHGWAKVNTWPRG